MHFLHRIIFVLKIKNSHIFKAIIKKENVYPGGRKYGGKAKWGSIIKSITIVQV